MVWPTIDETKPIGAQKVKDIDDAERETRLFTETALKEISNYTDNGTQPALRTTVWTTATRPTGSNLVDRVTGFNTTLGYEEYYDLATTTWKRTGNIIFPSHTVATRPTGIATGYTAVCSDLNVIERYNGSTWDRISGGRRGDLKWWSGSASDIEAGWCLADGVQRTHPEGGTFTPPNLRDKFLLGAGSTYAVGTTGGEATHTLTINEVPAHGGHYRGAEAGTGHAENPDGAINIWFDTSYGGGQAHNNMPPYFAACILYKL